MNTTPQASGPDSLSGEVASNEDLCLVLSGGGLRATLFHLGALLLLDQSQLLRRVRTVVAVSGGSILAAHLVKQWPQIRNDSNEFRQFAQELVSFARSDIRHKILIPWIWSRLSPLSWLSRNYGRNKRLQSVYDVFYQSCLLGTLDQPGRPSLALVATDAVKQDRIAFTSKAVLRFPIANFGDDPEYESWKLVTSKGVPLSAAVAGSSCFPPVFPRMRVTHTELGLNYAKFKETLNLKDGGVVDNLGIQVLLDLHRRGWVSNGTVILCNAEREMREQPSGGILSDQGAQSAALSSAAVAQVQERFGSNCVFIRLVDEAPRPIGLDFPVQTKLAVFRTDLDSPSWEEIQALLLHGFSVAAHSLAKKSCQNISPSELRNLVRGVLEAAGAPPNLPEPTAKHLESSHRRPARRVLLHLFSALLVGIVLYGAPFCGAWFLVRGLIRDKIELSLHPIQDVQAEYWIRVPQNHPGERDYLNRFFANLQQEIEAIGTRATNADPLGLKGLKALRTGTNLLDFEFNGEFPLSPSDEEKIASEVFEYTRLDFYFYRKPISPNDFPLISKGQAKLADLYLRFDSTLSNETADEETNYHWIAYGITNKQFQLHAKAAKAGPVTRYSNGEIASVGNLLGSQIFIHVPSFIITGDKSVDSKVWEIRKQFEFERAIVHIAAGRNICLDKQQFQRMTDTNGFPVYVWTLPTDLQGLNRLNPR